MQPDPQPLAQNRVPRQPKWLIYGLSFGVSISLLNLILVIITFNISSDAPFFLVGRMGPILTYTVGFSTAFFFLLYFSACLIAGILVTRKTLRAGSATLAGLLIGLLFLLSDIIFQSITYGMRYGVIDWRYILSIDFLVTCLGIYVGFLSGLIGRTPERTRRTIGSVYIVSVILISTALPFIVANLFLSFLGFAVPYASALMVLGLLCGMVAWIMTLIQLAQAQSWGYFTLTFFLSGLMVPIYLIVGVPPGPPAPYGVLPPGTYAPAAVAYPPMQSAPAQPPQPDAISILQQRFARGEIGAETYRQMLATLTNLPANQPHQ